MFLEARQEVSGVGILEDAQSQKGLNAIDLCRLKITAAVPTNGKKKIKFSEWKRNLDDVYCHFPVLVSICIS